MNTQRLHLIFIPAVSILIISDGCDQSKHEAVEKGTPSTQYDDHSPMNAHAEAHGNRDGEGHDHAHVHGDDDIQLPSTYAGAVSQIEHELHEIEELLEAGKVKEVHEACDMIVKICEQLPRLAMDKNSGVSKDVIKSINQVQKYLAVDAKKGHAASEVEDTDQLRVLLLDMAKYSGVLSSYVSHDDIKHDHHHE